MRKLVAALACRNGGSRLYGKPMQNLESATSRSVLFHIVENLRALGCIDQIVLGVSEGRENYGYIEFAEMHKLISIVGDQKDVLSRLVQCGDAGGATALAQRLQDHTPKWQKDQNKRQPAACKKREIISDLVIGKCATTRSGHTRSQRSGTYSHTRKRGMEKRIDTGT